jgi:hypothetical protein
MISEHHGGQNINEMVHAGDGTVHLVKKYLRAHDIFKTLNQGRSPRWDLKGIAYHPGVRLMPS